MHPKLSAILAELKPQLEEIYQERLVQMVLYGSQARGEATSDSDIDVLIVLQDPVNLGDEVTRVSPLISALSLKYNEVISCLFIEESRFKNRQGALLRNVRKEGIPI